MTADFKIWMIIWIPLLCSCGDNAPEISIVAEENGVGNSIIKWEISPMTQGNVKVYASTDPDNIPMNDPVAVAPIDDNRLTVIPPSPHKRYYYKLVFNDRYTKTAANRNLSVNGIQNFRDLGGYRSTHKHKHVKWGRLYRSGRIDSLSQYSMKEMKNIGIRTVVDLRTADELNHSKPLQASFNRIHIPISLERIDEVVNNIQKGVLRGDTIRTILEQINEDLVIKNLNEYSLLMKTLLNEENYPIVIQGHSGRSRTGIVSAIILAALGVDHETILEDYQLSNRYNDLCTEQSFAFQLPDYCQEAITIALSAKKSFLNAARNQIYTSYGNMDNFMNEGLGLTDDDIDKLRSLLLE